MCWCSEGANAQDSGKKKKKSSIIRQKDPVQPGSIFVAVHSVGQSNTCKGIYLVVFEPELVISAVYITIVATENKVKLW